MKITKRKIFFLAVIVVVIFFIYSALKPKGVAYKTEAVVRGDIAREISETGTVKRGDVVNLSFGNSGTIAKIYVKKGDDVRAGQLLAELDTSQLEVQARQAQSNLDLYTIQRDKLLNGASGEDIKIAQTAVINAQSSLDSAKLALSDTRDNAERKMTSLYKTAADVLNSAYAKAYNAGTFASLLQRTYFTPQDNDSIEVTAAARTIASSVAAIKNRVDIAANDYADALAGVARELQAIDGQLESIRAVCEKAAWRDTVDPSDKSGIDTQRDYVIAALASVNAARQNIDIQESANELAVNNAKAVATVAEGGLDAAGKSLSKVTAPPRQEDVDTLNAQIEQARAQMELLALQISDSRLKSPAAGQISEVNFREGEAAQSLLSSSGVMTLIPQDPYVIEADIYEEDIAKIKTGNPVVIKPASAPDDVYSGSVVSIDPSSKVVNGVVYYTITIAFDEAPESIKPGMSADVTITTAEARGVLLVPESAVQKRANEYYVRVVVGGQAKETGVEIGIKSKGQAQIMAGVKEGDQVIIE